MALGNIKSSQILGKQATWHVMGYRPFQQKYPPVLKFFTPPPPPPILKLFTHPLWLEMAASAFFTHSYFQQAHVHISEAIITD